jgi:circadian clock protein KaiC
MSSVLPDSTALLVPSSENSHGQPGEDLADSLNAFSASAVERQVDRRSSPIQRAPLSEELALTAGIEVVEPVRRLAKVRTGIAGLDEITYGGLPAGRPTLICGGPGCGKTILAMEILVRGAREFDEPGLFLSFEETAEHVIQDFHALGFHLEDLVEGKKLKIIHVSISKDEILQSGEFTLEGLLILLEHAIAEIGAKRVVLDTLEAVFTALNETDALRTEIARLFQWLKDKGITAMITGERGKELLTRHGFEEYISDCVILLDHRILEQTSKRRVRVVKYRGSGHAGDEFPFVIGENGVSILPITSLLLDHGACPERVSTGVKDLDAMLEGQGYFKGTTVLISGKAGTGKSSLASAFALAAVQRGERCLYFSFEESTAQIERNMQSLGMDLGTGLGNGLLAIRAFRPSFRGIEEHLVSIMRATEIVKPACVVLDPITNFVNVGGVEEVRSMLTRILDALKRKGITLVMTALTKGGRDKSTKTEAHLASLVDSWVALDLELKRKTRHRTLYVVKSRGMNHSQETRELIMSASGLSLSATPIEEGEAW